MTRIYAFANQKGGVGKTTSAVNIGAFLSAQGRGVLVVDIDPQANATSSLGLDEQLVESLKAGEKASIYHALIEKTPVAKIIQTTQRPRLHVVPSSPILAGAEVELVGMFARETLLHKSLAPVLSGETDLTYGADSYVGGEMGTGKWMRKGDYKAVSVAKPYGADKWQLFNVGTDPGETRDLSDDRREILRELQQAWDEYADDVGVVLSE